MDYYLWNAKFTQHMVLKKSQIRSSTEKGQFSFKKISDAAVLLTFIAWGRSERERGAAAPIIKEPDVCVAK